MTSGVPANPGWVVPSIVSGPVIAGSAELGAMVTAPLPMANSIASGPARVLAKAIAARSEPGPESALVVTLTVAAGAPAGSASARTVLTSAIRRALPIDFMTRRPPVIDSDAAGVA